MVFVLPDLCLHVCLCVGLAGTPSYSKSPAMNAVTTRSINCALEQPPAGVAVGEPVPLLYSPLHVYDAVSLSSGETEAVDEDVVNVVCTVCEHRLFLRECFFARHLTGIDHVAVA